MAKNSQPLKLQKIAVFFTVAFILLRHTDGAAQAEGQYSMIHYEDCRWVGILEVPRGQTTYLIGRSSDSGTEVTSCRLQFTPQTRGDTLTLEVLSGFHIDDPDTSLTVKMNDQTAKLGFQTSSYGLPKFEARDGVATVEFLRSSIDVSNYYFQVSIEASRSIDEPAAGGGGDTSDVGLIVGIIAAVILLIIVICVIFICCRRKRRERIVERNQFVNGGGAVVEPTLIDAAKLEKGIHTTVNSDSPGSNRRLLGKLADGSDDGTYSSGGGKSKSALDRFGPPPSQRRGRQQVGPNDQDIGKRREAYATESETDDRRPRPQARFGTDQTQRGARDPRQVYEDVDKGREKDDSPPASPLLSALRNNPKFRRSFHENEADAEDRARRVSASTSGESHDSHDQDKGRNRTEKPKLPPVPRSPPRSPSPQRRGEKIAAIYRARPSSSYDAARLDSEGSNDTPPKEEPPQRDTRHTLRPNRNKQSPDRSPQRDDKRRGRSRNDDYDDDESDREERRRQQRRMDREDEERQRRRRQEEEEEEREEEERRRKREKKKRDEERKRREEEEDKERSRRKAAKESDGSEYEGRFKKSASGRRSKGKGNQRMARSRSTGNALEDMEEQYQRSRSKSPGSTHSLNFIEGEDDETDLDSNYMPFRRAGSKTSLYASRSSLYGRRRKNSMGETVSISSRTALDDTDSRMGDFDSSRMSQSEMRRLFKSTGELEMRPESAHVVREVGTDTSKGGTVSVYGRQTVAKSRRGKRYSRGTQTLTSRSRDRRDSVGSAKSGRSTSSKSKLKTRSRSRESLGGRRSRSRGLTDDDDDSGSSANPRRHRRTSRSRSREKLDAATDDSDDDIASKRSGHSSRKSTSSKPRSRPRRSNHSTNGLSDDDGIADDQSVAPSSIAPSSVYGNGHAHPYAQYPQTFVPPQMMAAPTQMPGYPGPLVYQPVVAPGGPPIPYQPPASQAPVKPPIAPKPKPPTVNAPSKPAGSRWDDLVNLTDGMKKRRRQMGESVTEDGTESVLSSVWSRPTYTQQPTKVPPSYAKAQHMGVPDLSYSSNYPDSSGLTPPRHGHNMRMGSYSPSESNI